MEIRRADVIKADYLSDIGFEVRETGGTFRSIGMTGTSDQRAMTAASGTSAFVPSGPKLLEGNRIVLSSMPFVFPASPEGTLHNVGGGYGITSASARVETFVRFAGLISY